MTTNCPPDQPPGQWHPQMHGLPSPYPGRFTGAHHAPRGRVPGALAALVLAALMLLAGCGSTQGPAAHPAAVASQAASYPSTTPALTLTPAQRRHKARINRQIRRQQARQARQARAAAARRAAHARMLRRKRNTVEFIVTGSSANVTYGPSGTNLSGTVPMDVTMKLGNPIYYAIDAQLNGAGAVICEIKVGGRVMSHGSASGSYNIASCEIVQGLYGGWQDANSG